MSKLAARRASRPVPVIVPSSRRARFKRYGSWLGSLSVSVVALSMLAVGPGAVVASADIVGLGGGFSMPTVVGGSGATAIVTSDGVTTVGLVAVEAPLIVPTSLVVGAFAVGYGIGWTGVKAVGFAKDHWFTDHPPAPSAAGQTFSFSYGGVDYTVVYEGVTCDTSSNCQARWHTTEAPATGGGYQTPYRVTSVAPSGGGFYSDIWHNGTSPSATFSAGSLLQSQAEIQTTWRLVDGAGTVMATFPFTMDVQDSFMYQLVSTGDCIGPGVATTHPRAVSAPFHDGTDAPSDFPALSCPSGTHLFGLSHTIEKVVPNVAPETLSTASSWSQPEGANGSSPFADCMAEAVSPCQLDYVDKTGAVLDPNRAPNPSTGTTTTPDHCIWGTHVLTMAQCGPEPRDPTKPKPTPDPPVVTVPQDPNESGADCWPSGWGIMNPLEWVYKPTMCALTAAFVPDSATMTDAWGTARAGFDESGLPDWGGALGGVGSSLAGMGNTGNGCGGPHFSFTLAGHDYDFDPFNACSPPMDHVAFVVKLFAQIAICVAGVRFCARPLFSAMGWHAW
jgi:hypothetical protein